jgi:hypothetical protein
MSYLTDETRTDDEIIRDNLSKVAVWTGEKVDDGTLELRRQRAKQLEELERLDGIRFAKEVKAEEERKKRIDLDKFQRLTNGRHKLIKKDGQVIFKDSNCPYCDKQVKYVDAITEEEAKATGRRLYNPNVGSKSGYTDLEISYESEHQDDSNNYDIRHTCRTADPILDRKIEALRVELKAYKQLVKETYRTWPSM